MANTANSEILFSAARGTSIPWCFGTDILEAYVIEGKEAFQRLKAICERHATWQEAADEEGYWGAWHDVLMGVALRSDKGYVYRLEQDGDVFLVPHEEHITWVSDDEELSDNLPPENYSGYMEDPDEYKGHFEWKKGNASFDVNVCEEKH